MSEPAMIKILRGAEVDGPKGEAGRRHGIWAYHAPGYPQVCGYSRQPLLDACRQIKRMGGPTGQRAGLFREGLEVADISCPVEVGAAYTVVDSGVVRFRKYKPFDAAVRPDRVPEHLAAEIEPEFENA